MRGLASLLLAAALAVANLIPNGNFEAGLADWNSLWTREPGMGSAVVDTAVVHSGQAAVRIEHRGQQDWSFNSKQTLTVQPGDIYTTDA